MAKSSRSKVKRSHRAKKRETGVYAATEAARLQRLSSKLKAIAGGDKLESTKVHDDQRTEDIAVDTSPDAAQNEEAISSPDAMVLDGGIVQQPVKKISTHGRRMSRREEWRLSKGMSARSKSGRKNQHSGSAAKRKSGKPHRRR